MSRRAFGKNEVSCLLESESGDGVRSITLECEFYQRRYQQEEMLELFSNAARTLYENAPEALFTKIQEQEAWSDKRWQFRRVPHDGGGCDLRLSSLDLKRPLPTFSITEESSVARVKRSINVLLPTEISEEDLRSIATSIQSEDPNYAKTFIVYHVDGMDQANIAWATTHFTPNLDVKIHGLTRDDVERLEVEVSEVSTNVAGAWLDKTPYSGGRIELRLESERYSMIHQYADGSGSEKAVTPSNAPSGTRYDLVKENSFGEYYIVNRRGDLEIWDREGLISTATKIQ